METDQIRTVDTIGNNDLITFSFRICSFHFWALIWVFCELFFLVVTVVASVTR